MHGRGTATADWILGKKNRVKQPEDGGETRGISNEYNVGLRRTPTRACTRTQIENQKFKDRCAANHKLPFNASYSSLQLW
jgi:hypothetical protein